MEDTERIYPSAIQFRIEFSAIAMTIRGWDYLLTVHHSIPNRIRQSQRRYVSTQARKLASKKKSECVKLARLENVETVAETQVHFKTGSGTQRHVRKTKKKNKD